MRRNEFAVGLVANRRWLRQRLREVDERIRHFGQGDSVRRKMIRDEERLQEQLDSDHVSALEEDRVRSAKASAEQFFFTAEWTRDYLESL